MPSRVSLIDRTALKFNQGSIVTLVITAFAFQLPWLYSFARPGVAGGNGRSFSGGAFKFLYANVFRPLRVLRPDVIEEDNAQHLFAQGLGGIVLSVAFIFLAVVNQPIVGWILTFLVAALALVNLTVNFCLGCVLYLRLRRLSFFTRGFFKASPATNYLQGGPMASAAAHMRIPMFSSQPSGRWNIKRMRICGSLKWMSIQASTKKDTAKERSVGIGKRASRPDAA